MNYKRYLNDQLKEQKGKGPKGKGKKGQGKSKVPRERDAEKDWREAGRIALNGACRALSMVFRYYFNVCTNVEVPDNKGHDQARYGMGVNCSKYGFAHVGDIAKCLGTRFLNRRWTAADVMNVFYYDDHSREPFEKRLGKKPGEYKKRFQFLRTMWKSPSAISRDSDLLQRRSHTEVIHQFQKPLNAPTAAWQSLKPTLPQKFCTSGVHLSLIHI